MLDRSGNFHDRIHDKYVAADFLGFVIPVALVNHDARNRSPDGVGIHRVHQIVHAASIVALVAAGNLEIQLAAFRLDI